MCILYPRFDELNISTSVLSCKLSSKIDFMLLFLAYPINPHSIKCGDVNFMKCLSEYRGINHTKDKSKSKKSFKNSNMMVARISEDKIISIKVFEESFHISGCKDLEDTKNCILEILNNIYKIKKRLIRIKKNRKRSMKTLRWLLSQLKDKYYIIDRKDILNIGNYYVKKKYVDYTLKYRDISELTIPDHIDKKTVKFFMNCISDILLTNKKIYSYEIEKRLKHLIKCRVNFYENSGPLLHKPLTHFMVNLNTDLKFIPNRIGFRDVFSEYGYPVLYVNCFVSHVKILIPIEDETYIYEGRNKKNAPKSTIMVHRTGKVTHSSPHPFYLEKNYNAFINIILKEKSRLILYEK